MYDDRFVENISRGLKSFADAMESLGFISGGKSKLAIPSISDSSDDKERKQALRKLLGELASTRPEDALTDQDIGDVIAFFNVLYGGQPKYRHSYADICDVVFGLLDDSNDLDDGVPYGVNSLATNVNIVYSVMVDGVGEPSTQAESVLKLCDHIELERTRLKHFVNQNRRIAEYEKGRRELEKKWQDDRFETEKEFAEKVDSMRMEYIGILGVFAAIVLAFNGAVGFSTSSLSALGTASGLRALVFLASLVGFVLVNAIGVLMVFLWKMASGKKTEISPLAVACIVIANVVLVSIMAACAVLSLPFVRAFFGLPV